MGVEGNTQSLRGLSLRLGPRNSYFCLPMIFLKLRGSMSPVFAKGFRFGYPGIRSCYQKPIRMDISFHFPNKNCVRIVILPQFCHSFATVCHSSVHPSLPEVTVSLPGHTRASP